MTKIKMTISKVNLKKKLLLLSGLKRLKEDELKTILNYMNDSGIDELCECVYNLLYKNTNIKPKQFKKIISHIEKHRGRYTTICKKNKNFDKKRKLLIQDGKGIGMLIATAVPFIIDLISRAVKKKK